MPVVLWILNAKMDPHGLLWLATMTLRPLINGKEMGSLIPKLQPLGIQPPIQKVLTAFAIEDIGNRDGQERLVPTKA